MLADVARQSATAQGRAEWDKAIVAAEKKDRLRSTARPGLAIETQSARSKMLFPRSSGVYAPGVDDALNKAGKK